MRGWFAVAMLAYERALLMESRSAVLMAEMSKASWVHLLVAQTAEMMVFQKAGTTARTLVGEKVLLMADMTAMQKVSISAAKTVGLLVEVLVDS